MTTTEPTPHDTSTDIRRLNDAGYTVTFSPFPLTGPGADYYAEITSEYGSRWKCFGATPGEAIRSNWPLGDGPGRGGCAHCGGLGCEAGGCPMCTAYTDEPGNGVCGVCGQGHPGADDEDDAEPYCETCGAQVAIFHGLGDGWHHYRGNGTAETPNELYDAGHAPAVAWRHPGADAVALPGDEGDDSGEDGDLTPAQHYARGAGYLVRADALLARETFRDLNAAEAAPLAAAAQAHFLAAISVRLGQSGRLA